MAPRGVRTRGGVDQDQQALGGRINSEHDLEGHPTGSVFAGKPVHRRMVLSSTDRSCIGVVTSFSEKKWNSSLAQRIIKPPSPTRT